MQIVDDIKKSADELKKHENINDVEYGQLLGYAETLSIIRDACSGYDLKEIGLDFDIDKNYLYSEGTYISFNDQK